MKKTALKQLTALSVLCILVIGLQSCNEQPKEKEQTGNKFNLETAKKEIMDANKEFATLFASYDSIALAKLYTQDAKFMGEGAPAVIGRINIQSALAGMMNSGITNANLATIEVWGMENLITEEGEATLYVGDTQVYKGKYIVIWKKVDGEWKIFRDIFNSNSPAQ
jgi:ketosteroid isomerase-like protein